MTPFSQAPPSWWTSPAVVRCLPFGIFIGILAVRGLAQTVGLDASPLYALQAGVAGLVLAALVAAGRYQELRAAPRSPVAWTVAAVLGVGVFVVWINATLPWMRLSEPAAAFSGRDADGALRTLVIAIRFAGAVLVVPLMEELFWRSFLMRWLDRRDFLSLQPHQASHHSLLATSVVFALAHDLWLAGFLAGLAYGELYRRSGNLWYPVAAHAITNALLGAWVIGTESWGFW